MNKEMAPNFASGPEKKLENKKNPFGQKLFEEQIKEAISAEDYEQASYLQKAYDKLKSEGQFFDQVFKEDLIGKDVQEEEDGPGSRAWQGIKAKQSENMFFGREIVSKSPLSEYLLEKGRFVPNFVQELWENVELFRKSNDKDKRTDFLIRLYEEKEEADDLIKLSRSKYDSIKQPLIERIEAIHADKKEETPVNLSGVSEVQRSARRVADETPRYIGRALDYWSGIYDGATRIAGEIDMAIKEMKDINEAQ